MKYLSHRETLIATLMRSNFIPVKLMTAGPGAPQFLAGVTLPGVVYAAA